MCTNIGCLCVVVIMVYQHSVPKIPVVTKEGLEQLGVYGRVCI